MGAPPCRLLALADDVELALSSAAGQSLRLHSFCRPLASLSINVEKTNAIAMTGRGEAVARRKAGSRGSLFSGMQIVSIAKHLSSMSFGGRFASKGGCGAEVGGEDSMDQESGGLVDQPHSQVQHAQHVDPVEWAHLLMVGSGICVHERIWQARVYLGFVVGRCGQGIDDIRHYLVCTLVRCFCCAVVVGCGDRWPANMPTQQAFCVDTVGRDNRTGVIRAFWHNAIGFTEWLPEHNVFRIGLDAWEGAPRAPRAWMTSLHLLHLEGQWPAFVERICATEDCHRLCGHRAPLGARLGGH